MKMHLGGCILFALLHGVDLGSSIVTRAKYLEREDQSDQSALNIKIVSIRRPELRTTSNMYICNMAVSDMMICLVSAPLTPLTAFTGTWHLGQVMCKLVPTLQVRSQDLKIS